MSSSRVSFVPSTILTTSTNALAGTNGAVTFLNVPRDGQPSTLSSTGSFKLALPRSSTSGQGTSLQSVNINYSIEDNDINSVSVSLSTQSFGPGSVVTAIPTTPSGFTLTPGNYTGVVTVDAPAYANSANPEYYLLDVTVVVGTSVITELRINDVELVYITNSGGSFPDNVNIPGYLTVGPIPTPTTNGQPTVQISRGFDSISSLADTVNIDVKTTTTLTTTIPSRSFLYTERMTNIVSSSSDLSNITTRTFLVGNDIVASTGGATFEAYGIQATGGNFREGAVGIYSQAVGISARGATFTTNFSGTVTEVYGIAIATLTGSFGNIGTAYGIRMFNPGSTGISVTRNYGLYVNAQGRGTTTNACIVLEGATSATNNYGLWVNSNSAGTGTGLVFGTAGDTSMYRGAANQLLTPGDWSSRHYLCSSTPTVAAGAGAGTAPTIAITGTDHGFTVTLTTGTTATINATLFTVTWGAAWTSSAPAVTWAPGNAATAGLAVGATPFTSAVSTTAMTFTSNATALADSTGYIFRFTAMR